MTKQENGERQTPKAATPLELTTSSNNASKFCCRSLSHISEGSTGGAAAPDEPAGELWEIKHSTPRLSCSKSEQLRETPERHFSATVADDSTSQTGSGFNRSTSDESVTAHQESTAIEEDLSSVLEPGKDLTLGSPTQDPTDADLDQSSTTPKYKIRSASVEKLTSGKGANERVGPTEQDLEEALGDVVSSLADYRGQFPELHLLETELKLLLVLLKVIYHVKKRHQSAISVKRQIRNILIW